MPRRSSQTAGKVLKRAIAKSDPTKQRPTVGEPVIIDPPKKTRLSQGAPPKTRHQRPPKQEG
ncbi:MAG: hypothetical protein ABWY63_09390 [Hyphomicrobiaceae bacterium]|jgi:hypothetical protein